MRQTRTVKPLMAITVEQVVNAARAVSVSALDQHCIRARSHQQIGLMPDGIFGLCNRALAQFGSFDKIGGQDRGQGHNVIQL